MEELLASDIGYKFGGFYCSMSGTAKKNNGGSFGSLMILMLLNLLEQLGMAAWDLGMSMSYKTAMGARNFPRKQFLSFLKTHRNQCKYFGFEAIRRGNFQAIQRQGPPVASNRVSVFEMPIVQTLLLQIFKERHVNSLRRRQKVFAKRVPREISIAFRNKTVSAEHVKMYFRTLFHENPAEVEGLLGGLDLTLDWLVKEVQKIHESKVLSVLSKKKRKRVLQHFQKKFNLIS